MMKRAVVAAAATGATGDAAGVEGTVKGIGTVAEVKEDVLDGMAGEMAGARTVWSKSGNWWYRRSRGRVEVLVVIIVR